MNQGQRATRIIQDEALIVRDDELRAAFLSPEYQAEMTRGSEVAEIWRDFTGLTEAGSTDTPRASART